MIIVEGPDGAGKSTLVKNLADAFRFEIGERATKDRSKLYTVTRQDTYTALAKAVKAHKKPQIWDRLFFSEMVYAPVVGRPCEFSAPEQLFVRQILAAMGCPIILCRPPLEIVEANVLKADQMKGVNENIRSIYNAYGGVAEHMPNVLWYDYSQELTGQGSFVTYEAIGAAIKKYFDHRKKRSWQWIGPS